MRHKAKTIVKVWPGVLGSSLAGPDAGNSHRVLGLLRNPPKGVK